MRGAPMPAMCQNRTLPRPQATVSAEIFDSHMINSGIRGEVVNGTDLRIDDTVESAARIHVRNHTSTGSLRRESSITGGRITSLQNMQVTTTATSPPHCERSAHGCSHPQPIEKS